MTAISENIIPPTNAYGLSSEFDSKLAILSDVAFDLSMEQCGTGEILDNDQTCLTCPLGTFLINNEKNSEGPCK